uniref:ribonuclease P protein component n=1 Tax=Leucobacter sp. BZR 635 TaxID=3378705 RepID=UPI003A87AE1F
MPARHHRVTRGEDYRRVVRTGNRVGGAMCITYAVRRSSDDPRQEAPRFGYIISKAVGNAVTRNLVRRRMKSISDEFIRDGVTGVDVVFRALPRAAEA